LAFAPDLVHVPFGGGAPALAAVVAGHTPIGMGAPTVAVPLVNDGKVRALAVTSKARTQALPHVPTMAESGYPDIAGDSFVGFVVPAGTPKDVIALLNREIVKSLATAEMKERQAALGNDVVASTPEEFGQRIRAELLTWAKVIKAANIKAGGVPGHRIRSPRNRRPAPPARDGAAFARAVRTCNVGPKPPASRECELRAGAGIGNR